LIIAFAEACICHGDWYSVVQSLTEGSTDVEDKLAPFFLGWILY